MMRAATHPMSWIIVLLLVAIVKHLNGFTGVLGDLALPDSDDYVRLAQVRDWMAGAAWFDVTQERLGPGGIVMHWSRLIDLPLAALVRFFALFTTMDMAEKLTAIAWPLMTLIAFAGLSITTARRLETGAHPFVIVLLLSVHAMTANQFVPGRIDHHNVQIILIALVFLGALDRDLRRGGLMAGLACAASMVVGMEALVPIAVFGLLFAGGWVSGVDAEGARFGAFGVGFAGGIVAGYAVGVAPADYASTVCDALSLSYGVPVVVAGAGAFGLALASARLGGMARAGACVALAIVSVGALYLIAPTCMAGPYAAISDEAATRWLSRIVEAKGLVRYMAQLPFLGASFVLLAMIGIGAGFMLSTGTGAEDRWRRAVVVVPTVAILALSFLQARQGQFVGVFAIPATAAAYAVLRRRVTETPVALPLWSKATIGLAVGGLIVYAASAPFQGSRVTQAAAPEQMPVQVFSKASCLSRAAYAELAALPRGRVLNPHMIGGRLLTMTGHHVLVGPYHRSSEAVLDGIDLIDGNTPRIRTIVQERQAQYVAVCLHETAVIEAVEGDFMARLVAGDAPRWLTPLYASGGLHVYRTDVPL